MSKNGLFFVASPRLQSLWRRGQVLVFGKLICGELRAGEHIVVYFGEKNSETVVCRGIIKQQRKVAIAWAGEDVFLILPDVGAKIQFAAAPDWGLATHVKLQLAAEETVEEKDWKPLHKVMLMVPGYFYFSVEAEIVSLDKKDDASCFISLRLVQPLFLALGQEVVIFSATKRLKGQLAEALA